MGKKWTYSEETRQARLEGLAKARAARALKHQATQAPPQTEPTPTPQTILIEKPKINTDPLPKNQEDLDKKWVEEMRERHKAYMEKQREKEFETWNKPSVKDRLLGWFNLIST